MNNLGDRIKLLRKDKEWTQSQLAEKLGITDKAISKWEMGDSNPDLNLISTIAKIFDVSIDYLLTGKESVEKVVVMSKLELACKNDNEKYINPSSISINSLMTNDEDGHNFYYYVEKYLSVKIFDSFLKIIPLKDVFSVGNVCWRKRELFELLVKFEKYKELEIYNMLYPVVDRYNKYEIMSAYHEKNVDYIIDNKKDKVMKKMLSMYKNKGNKQHFNYFRHYGYLISTILKKKNLEMTKLALSCIIELDEKSLQFFEDDKKANVRHLLVDGYSLPDNCNIDTEEIFVTWSYDSNVPTKRFYIFALGETEIIEVLNLGLTKEARFFNEINKKLGRKMVEENQFVKYEMLKIDPKVDGRIYDVMSSDIVIYNRLIATEDAEFIVDVMSKQPICYAEYIYSLLLKKNYRRLYELFVDKTIPEFASKMLTADETSDRYIYKIISILLLSYSFDNNWKLKEMQNQISEIIKIDELNRSFFDRMRNFVPQSISQFIYYNRCNGIDAIQKDIENVLNFIKEKKKEVISKFDAKIQFEKTKKQYSKDYFYSEMKKNNLKNVIVELCIFFETKLKANSYLGDFSEMLSSHCRTFYGDDGWGNWVCLKPQLNDALYRLRISRNNYLHPETKEISPLTIEEVKLCVDYICDLEVQ